MPWESNQKIRVSKRFNPPVAEISILPPAAHLENRNPQRKAALLRKRALVDEHIRVVEGMNLIGCAQARQNIADGCLAQGVGIAWIFNLDAIHPAFILIGKTP